MRNDGGNFSYVQALLPSTITTTTNGTGKDSAGHKDVLCILSLGDFTGTSPTVTVKLQNSDAVGGTYTDIVGATFGTIDGTGDTIVKAGRVRLSGNRTKKWIRAVATVTGTTPNIPICVEFLFGDNPKQPQTVLTFDKAQAES